MFRASLPEKVCGSSVEASWPDNLFPITPFSNSFDHFRTLPDEVLREVCNFRWGTDRRVDYINQKNKASGPTLLKIKLENPSPCSDEMDSIRSAGSATSQSDDWLQKDWHKTRWALNSRISHRVGCIGSHTFCYRLRHGHFVWHFTHSTTQKALSLFVTPRTDGKQPDRMSLLMASVIDSCRFSLQQA